LAELGALSESALVILARQGDDAAFAQLVRQRQRSVRGLLRRLSGEAALADDLAQDTFMQAWQNLHGLRTPEAFGTWLRQIAVNVWLRHARRKRIQLEPLDESHIADYDQRSERRDADAHLMDLEMALDQLRPAQRTCVVLAYAEGMSHAEIAAVTGLPLGTVKSHVARAAARLRHWLEPDSVMGVEVSR
jgi:RNA polymerase sigma-70 factor (ECF subfamily)